MKRLSALVLALLTAALCVLPAGATEPLAVLGETTILFTHDLHSHFLPQSTGDGESGGYARLKTVIDRERAAHPDALLLDGGDFSIGSLVQTLYTDQAAELRTMGALGYDAATIGNHEFDHKGVGFGEMLNSAKAAQTAAMGLLTDSQYPPRGLDNYQAQYGPVTLLLPALLEANYAPAADNPDRDFIQAAMDYYGVADCMTLERGGVTYGIFGLMGKDSDECAPTSGFTRTDPTEAAARCVEALEAQGAEVIICLSHSGTGDSLETSEDEKLAKAVDGIDVIISGHTHSTLTEPLVVNDTYIVSCGPYCRNLGSLTLERISDGSLRLAEYRLIPIDETVPEDADITAMVAQWTDRVGETYLARYGLTYDQVLTHTDFDLNTPTSGVQEGNNLGELVSDAFLWADQTLNPNYDGSTHTIAVTAGGVLRASLPAGDITTSMAFDVLSMGVGEDGTSGFPLVAVYLTGKEVKAAMEVDASVTPIMPAVQLYMSGAEYKFNTRRMFFNRVYDAEVVDVSFEVDCGLQNTYEIEDDRLYRIVSGMYSAQMLGTVKSKSMGLLSLEPKMADGSPVTDFTDCILYDENGSELKEWYALAAYLEQFGEDGVSGRYEEADSRKTVSRSVTPRQLLTNWNWITWAVMVIALLLLALIVLLVRVICRRIRRKSR